jgi:hypothetical protein
MRNWKGNHPTVSAFAKLLRLTESRSVPAFAHDNLLLHMQQKVAHGNLGLKVRPPMLPPESDFGATGIRLAEP